jgi:hypothetical protein
MNAFLKLVGVSMLTVLFAACGNTPETTVMGTTISPLPSASVQIITTSSPSSTANTNLVTPSPLTVNEMVNEFSFASNGKVKSIEKTSFLVRQGFSLDELVSNSKGCGVNSTREHFATVLKMYAPTDKATEYHFVYNGASQSPSEWIVIAMANKPNYQSLDDFKRDFDICDGGAMRYPFQVSPSYLLFVSSCGTGFSDGSGLPNGCAEIQEAVTSTIKLNSKASVSSTPATDTVSVPTSLYTNTEYQFSLDFGSWGQPKISDVTTTYKSLMPIKAAYSFTADQNADKVLTIFVVPLASQEDPAIVDAPMVSMKQNATYAFYYSSSGDNTGAPEMEDAKWDAIYKEAKAIAKTFKLL